MEMRREVEAKTPLERHVLSSACRMEVSFPLSATPLLRLLVEGGDGDFFRLPMIKNERQKGKEINRDEGKREQRETVYQGFPLYS